MNCAVCGAENREDRKFCRECGNPLALACPNCGTHNEPGDKFCGSCGHALGDAVAPTQQAQPEAVSAEKRFVSVLFADLVDYTTYVEASDSEDVRDMLTIYFDRSREIVERFGGTIDKFIGDAVMGVWGATGGREDDAERAVRAALELVDMVAALGAELNHPELVLRAGVNSGSAVVGPGGNDQGMIVGDLVNTAARLQSIADPGTVFVGASTHSVTSHAIHYESMGEREVKGKTESVAAWKAVRVAGLIGGRLESELRHPPFVGREREMRLLKDELAAVESEQRARLVSIIGEGGVGKTRLSEEFKKHVDGFTDDVYWHQGRSPSYGDGVAFWALGEMVRRRAGIAEGEDQARARTRLRTCVAEFVPGEEDRRWIEPRLEGLLGLANMPPGGRDELFSALRSFFQHIAMRGTTILVFEDLHWADIGLMDFISELADRSTRSPMLIVTLGRLDVLDHYPTWGSQHRNSMSVRLAPLTEDHMREMVTEYLPGADAGVVEKIVERSAGFPLYAVEMVRMLVASGDLVEEADGEWSFRGDADSLALPESLQAVIGARLDRLDPAQRSVLQDGAILGQKFTVAAIKAIRGGDAPDLEMLLRGLTQLEILDIEEDPRSPERGQYRFVQSLIHEVAYRRLGRQDRRDKHLAAAAFFESFDDPELAGVVAGHYMGAFSATPEGPERDEMASRALHGLTDAAARAAELGSHPRAMGLLEQAIELATDDDQIAEFRITAALSASAQSDVDRAIAYIEPALAHFVDTGNLDGERRAATTYSEVLNSNFRSDEALSVIRPLYDGLDNVDDPVGIGVAAEAGRSLSLNFDPEAITAIDRLLPGAAALGLDRITLESFVTLGTAYSWNQRWTEALVVLRGAALVAEDLGLLRTAGRAYNNLAAISYIDSPRRAAEYAASADEIVSRLGDFGWMVRKTVDNAGVDAGEGRYDAALARLDTFEDDQLSDFWKATYALNRSFVDLARGVPGASVRAFDAISFFDDDNDPQLRWGMDQSKCAVLQFEGRWDEAFELATQIDHLTTGVGLYEGMKIAAWTGRLDRIEQVISKLDENTAKGRFVDGVRLYAAGVRAALTGDRETAIEIFDRLLPFAETIVLGNDLAMIRATYAMLVGQDHPAAAAAAQAAQEWLVSTGSNGLAKMWAAGLPGSSETEAAG